MKSPVSNRQCGEGEDEEIRVIWRGNESSIDILNDNSSLVGEFLEVGLKGEIIMDGLDVGGQDLTALDFGRARDLAAARATHSAV